MWLYECGEFFRSILYKLRTNVLASDSTQRFPDFEQCFSTLGKSNEVLENNFTLVCLYSTASALTNKHLLLALSFPFAYTRTNIRDHEELKIW